MTENMNFQKEFMRTKGKPIHYKGREILLGDCFDLSSHISKVKFRIISTDSEWKQGVEIDVKGTVKINGQTLKKGIRLWEDTVPEVVVFEVKTKEQKIFVSNLWDWGDGVTQKWHNGAAMYFEPINNGKRYYCNDGHPDDDFDDIVFEITELKS